MAGREPISFLATAKPAETAAFYQDVLGLAPLEDTMFALVFSDNGHMLRIQKIAEHNPPGHTLYGWTVPDIAAEVERLAGKGVEFTLYPGMGQAQDGVWTSPNGDKVAWFLDPAGNNLSLTQFASSSA